MTQSNNFLPSIILALGIVFAGYFIGRTYVSGKALDRTVEVKGLAEREVEANLAVWPLQITVSSNDLGELQNTLDRQSKVLVEFFQEHGFDKGELTVSSPNIQDTKAQVYGSNNYNPFRYIAVGDFTIRTSDLGKLENATSSISSIIGQGIVVGSKNQWQPVQYLFTKLNDIKPEMIEEATKNAREAAEKFARDSGSKVGKLKSARQGIFSIFDRDVNTGQIKKVRVVSTLEFYLED